VVVFVVVVLVALIAPPVPAAPPAPVWTVAFDDEVAGDLAVVGNTVTGCPPAGAACRAAEAGAANGALNNAFSMVWTDTDDDPRTVTSSSATLDIPAGARVVHATLSWAGTLHAGSTGLCGRTGTWPPGSPREIRLAVGDDPSSPLPANGFAAAPVPTGADRWYSADADVTDRFTHIRGPVGVTVADVWTGRGFDCAGGWSLTVAWSGKSAPRHRVVVYTGHQRIANTPLHSVLRPPGLHVAGGTTRLGVAALEGDRALVGDSLLVNGAVQPEPGNFFVSAAPGARAPAHVNNMSVDAKTIELGPGVVRPGDNGVDVVATGGVDHYLLNVLALSVPLSGLAVATTLDRPVSHEGDAVAQHAVVTNTGAVPLRGIGVTFGLDAACAKTVDLAPGERIELTCAGRARPGALVVSAAGTDLAGEAVSATATATARVIHPRLDVAVTTANAEVLAGQPVEHRVVVANSGDAALSSVRVRAPGCDGVVAASLAPGAVTTTTCTGPAAPGPVTASAVDELAAPVTATGPVRYRLVRVGLTIDVVVPDGAVAPGAVVTLTVRVRNTSDVPLRDVTVFGEPSSCHRVVPELAAGAVTVYTCRVVATGPTTVALTVSGVARLAGGPAAAVVGRAGTVTLTPREIPPPASEIAVPVPAAPAPAPRSATDPGPLRAPATPAILALLGVLVMTLSVGGLATATRR
jgi:hypothetical protein